MTGSAVHSRREVIRIALAAAEVCWVTPVFLALSRTSDLRPLLLLWLSMLVVYLGFSYIYRALVEAHLPVWLQQTLLILTLLASIVLILRFHAYAGSQWYGINWLLEPFRQFSDEMTVLPAAWVDILTMVYFWVRGINLARRSISVESVGFSFRLAILILMGVALAVGGYLDEDVSGFIIPFFFFSLVSIALARVEEVSRVPNSSHVGYSGFWIGSTLGAVVLLMLVGMVVALFFYGGGLRQVLRLLSPLWLAVQIVIAAIGVLFLALLELIFSFLSIDLGALGQRLQEALQRLGQLAGLAGLFPPSEAEAATRPPFLSVLQAVTTIGLPLAAILIVVLITWNRVRRARHREGDEIHESLLTAGTLANHLRAALAAGRDRLGDLAGLVDRFGLGARFLSAISIRRIYANLVRLATEAGYPRAATQTPYEYLRILHRVLPGSEADVAVITEAYVNAHYGQVPDSREGLQAIRDCWERVRARELERQKRSKPATEKR
jgi:hypothetical protein